MDRVRSSPDVRCANTASRISYFSTATSRNGEARVFVKNAHNACIVIGALTVMAAFSTAAHLRAQNAPSAQQKLSRLDRLEAWVAAVNQHMPGTADDAALEINQWSAADLHGVWIDVTSLASLVREPSVSVFFLPGDPELRLTPSGWATVTPPTQTNRAPISYSGRDLERLRKLAASLGSPNDGRENLLLKRGAMLHADIAMLAPADARFIVKPGSTGSRRYRLYIDDGRPKGIQTEANHWDMGRRLLDRVRYRDPKGGAARGPALDDTVRLWYIATCAYLISVGDLDPAHFVRAVELFPKNPDLLFLRAALHESMAGARRQSAMRTADVPAGVSFTIGSRGDELLLAERFYERALENAPMFDEARVRYARVLGQRRHHEEALAELQKLARVEGPPLQYYTALFLGGELDALGKDDEARRAYERAAALSPTAQSPRLALSRLAAGRDRFAAREALLMLAEQEPQGEARDDPWWAYDIAAGRGADLALTALFRAIESQGR
jgi:tetratricopeptide (TPR) repeat protein